MPKISGYNGCQGFNHYDDQLAISQNQLSQNINDVQSQCVPASLDGLSVVNPTAQDAYLYVDDGSKKKVALSDVLNTNLNGTFKSLENKLKSNINDLDSKLDAVDKRLDIHGERLNRERELEWKQLLAIKNIEANMVNLSDNVNGINNTAQEAIETAAKAVEKYNNYKEDLTRILERLDIHNDRLDRERIWEWQQLVALRKELAKKQDRLIAGKGIKLEGNVIWCEYEGGGLTEEEVKQLLKSYPTNEELEVALDAIRADILKLADDISKIEKPVNADWNETDPSNLSYIKNKPVLDNFATKADVDNVKKLIPKVDHLATKAALADEVQKLNKAKQDKLTAGENITIENGVISAIDTICNCTECKIGVDFITNVTVGNLPAGTEISADTTLADLLQRILMKPQSNKTILYLGGSLDIPSSLNGLSQYEVSTDAMLADSGIVITTPYVEEGYLAIAYPSEYKLVKWGKADGTFDYTNTLSYVYNINGYTISYMSDSLFMWDAENCLLKFTQEGL